MSPAAQRLGVTRSRPARGGTCLVTESGEVIVHLAVDNDGRSLLATEARRLAWAAALGVAVPEVVESGDGVLVTRRVRRDPLTGADAVAAAVGVAALVAAAAPPQRWAEDSRTWRGRRRTLLRRVCRGTRHGVDWRRFAAARAAYSRLADRTLAHGDFQDDNLLWDAAARRLVVVDWEYLGVAPRHTDLLNLWSQLPGAEERALILDAVEQHATTPAQRCHLADVALWLAHRHHAQVACGVPRPGEEPRWRDQLGLAADRVADAARLAQRWTSS